MLQPIYICGSTASGKSSFAIALAKKINGEIVNGDAYQLYQGIETLSAAPSAEEHAQVPHHLFSCLDSSEPVDAQRYRDLTLPRIASIQQQGKRPIVVGGSGMYLKFLTHGPSPVPSGNEALRAQLETKSDSELAQQLEDLDPDGAAMTNLKNRRYLIRALEICILSESKMSVLKSDWANTSASIEKKLLGFVLQWEPEALRKRIAHRTQLMLEGNAIQEVKNLTAPSITCEKAIGIKQIRQYLAGEISLHRCNELIYFATSQYAKRQRTWFKKEHWLHKIAMQPSTQTQQIVDQSLFYLEQKSAPNT